MRIALVAGEASGDALGAALIEALRRRFPGAQFAGVAGPRMIAAGCNAWFHSEELGVMGLTEVLRHLPRLLRPLMRDADLTLGSRYVRGGGTVGWPLHRQLISRAGTFFTSSSGRLRKNCLVANPDIVRLVAP